MAKDPSCLFYWNDWHGGTVTFSRHLKGCYMDLLYAQFNSGRLSLEEIKTVLGSDFGQTWPTLQKKFVKDETGLFYNERLDNEKTRRKKFSEKQSERRGGKTKLKPDRNQNATNKENANETGIEDLYLNPKDYLLSKISVTLTELNMKSLLSPEEFDFCLTQWSLAVIEKGFEYSGNDDSDRQRLQAGFEKWLNSWVKNNAQKHLKQKNGHGQISNNRESVSRLKAAAIADLLGEGDNAQ